MKKFYVEDEVFEILPELNVGVLVLKDVSEDKKLSDSELKEIKEILDNANSSAKKYIESDVISENKVVKVWRDTYSKFPTKKGARCSVENLIKRVLHDNPVGTILPSVDITNAISLEYALPIGAEDLDKVDGDIYLGVMKGDEHFLPIGSEKEDLPLEGEIAYRDNYGVVCRCLNWRDGVRTQIDDDTKVEFIAMECVEMDRIPELKEALLKLEKYMTKYLGAEVVTQEIVNKNNKSINLY